MGNNLNGTVEEDEREDNAETDIRVEFAFGGLRLIACSY